MAAFSRFLRYFLAVARYGSIRRASDELRIAASAVDRQLLQGEAALGVALFERLPSGMRLTAAGETLYAHALRWAREFDDVTRQIEDLKGLRRGQVDLVIPEALAAAPVTAVVTRLRRDHPGIGVTIRIEDNSRIRARLDRGEADLAMLLDPDPARGLLVRASARFPLGIVSAPALRLHERASLRFSVCAEEPTIAPIRPLAIAEVFERLEAAMGAPVRRVASSNNVAMIRSLVAAGTGISLLSALDVMDDLRENRLCFTPLDGGAALQLSLALVHDRGRPLSVAARLVADSLEQALAEMVPAHPDSLP
ncbi:LysR family transcriptional regulator [Acidomonas methanolica]|uniref:LysR family transcriptional regulator n=1 Tax=Acidomonas methanolica TaxID=437 RepID=UPI002119DB83|nr:LysR family transcriptional regulator [Acidomonas methanolica]MCQ9156957.1 LysR family transcriptional regulator [Acidomonas methanolica]